MPLERHVFAPITAAVLDFLYHFFCAEVRPFGPQGKIFANQPIG
jgi:hypothetical protein